LLFLVWLRAQGSRLRKSLSSSIQNIDARESRDRTAVADRVALRGLPLAVAERATELICRLAAQQVAGLPEFRRVRLVREIAKLSGDLAVLHFPERLAAELEVVALMIDAVARVALDVYTVVGRTDDVRFLQVLLARLERDVRHALEGNRAPAIGV